jgi:hypothetical protein
LSVTLRRILSSNTVCSIVSKESPTHYVLR